MTALAGVELESIFRNYWGSEVYVVRFQNYEYTLSEIFITCGT